MVQPRPFPLSYRRLILECSLLVYFLSMPVTDAAAKVIARKVCVPSQQTARSSEIAAGDKVARRLEPGQPVEREITGREVHAYEIVLDRQFLEVVVDQRTANLAIAVFD